MSIGSRPASAFSLSSGLFSALSPLKPVLYIERYPVILLFFLAFLQFSRMLAPQAQQHGLPRNREGRGRSRWLWRGANNRIYRRAALAETTFVSHDKRQ